VRRPGIGAFTKRDEDGSHGIALIYAAACTGMRCGELEALRVTDLDLSQSAPSITITRSLREVRGQLRIGPTKTGKARTIGIPQFLATMLRQRIENFPSKASLVFVTGRESPFDTATSIGGISVQPFARQTPRP